MIREASGQAGDDGEYRRTYRCAACMGQEWETSTREALFRIRDGRWDINKRRKLNAAFDQASSTIAQNAPGLSRGERRNLARNLARPCADLARILSGPCADLMPYHSNKQITHAPT